VLIEKTRLSVIQFNTHTRSKLTNKLQHFPDYPIFTGQESASDTFLEAQTEFLQEKQKSIQHITHSFILLYLTTYRKHLDISNTNNLS
jgi:hypothetical protein